MVPIVPYIQGPGFGNIIGLIEWALNGGPVKWCDDVTYDDDKTITQLFIAAKTFTVSAAKTLTLTVGRPLVVVADTISIAGTITASGKGCSALSDAGTGRRCSAPSWPFWRVHNEEASSNRNYCLCGSGGGSTGNAGGGAYADGGAGGHDGYACDLTDVELKQLLFSPGFNIFQSGLGGSGGGYSGQTSGAGGGTILLIGKIIIISATGSILANGLGTSTSVGAGGGGFIGLVGGSLSINGAATIIADGGVASGAGFDGGAGAIAQISA